MLLDTSCSPRSHGDLAQHAAAPWTGSEMGCQRLVLSRYLPGRRVADCFRKEPMHLPAPTSGQLLLKTHLVSMDISARARIQSGASPGDILKLGDVMPSATVSRVEQSRHPAFRAGDFVLAQSGWQTHEVVDGCIIKRKLYPRVAPVSSALGVYGLEGFIAWLAVREVCRPQPGQTAVVAAAAGPLGGTACQLLQDRGARVVAVTRGANKCTHVRDQFAPAAVLDIDDPEFAARLAAACPEGIDILIENVDGGCLDAALPLLNEGARLPLCHAMDSSGPGNDVQADRLPLFLNIVMERRVEVRPFTGRALANLQTRYLADPEFISEIGLLLRNGRLRWLEEVMEGLDALPLALDKLVQRQNVGKLLVRLD